MAGPSKNPAAAADKSPALLAEPVRPADPRNHLRLGYRMGFDVGVDFRNARPFAFRFSRASASGGGGASSTSLPVAPGGYSDGFVLDDVSGGAGGKTWYWGYDNNSQVVGDSIVFTRQTGTTTTTRTSTTRDITEDAVLLPGGVEDLGEDPSSHGVELVYGRDLATRGPFTFGLEAGVSYNRLDASSGTRGMAPVQLTTHEQIRRRTTTTGTAIFQRDTFGLDGVIPPLAPYAGTFAGPGPLLDNAPSASTVTRLSSAAGGRSSSSTRSTTRMTQAWVEGDQSVEADFFIFRLGPYVETDLTDRLSAAIGAGALVNFVNADLAYRESIFIPGVGGIDRQASSSESDVLFGGYGDARLQYRLFENFSIFANGQVNFSSSLDARVGTKDVTLDFGTVYFAGIGAALSF